MKIAIKNDKDEWTTTETARKTRILITTSALTFAGGGCSAGRSPSRGTP